jgi:3-oxoadipate enol-lactonase
VSEFDSGGTTPEVINRWSGQTVLVLPGIQGRWEWHAPAITALARQCRVLSFSYADETAPGAPARAASCADRYCAQARDVILRTGGPVTLCGISYGGLIAALVAARHPELVRALVLASALPPDWRPSGRVRWYLRAPRLLTPLFLIASLRMWTEIRAASPTLWHALTTSFSHTRRVLRHMFRPTRMAQRARDLADAHYEGEVATVRIPTLVVVGDPLLDRVVRVSDTLRYCELLPHARVANLTGTGHIGSVTKPEAFATLVAQFAADPTAITTRRHVG